MLFFMFQILVIIDHKFIFVVHYHKKGGLKPNVWYSSPTYRPN